MVVYRLHLVLRHDNLGFCLIVTRSERTWVLWVHLPDVHTHTGEAPGGAEATTRKAPNIKHPKPPTFGVSIYDANGKPWTVKFCFVHKVVKNYSDDVENA